MSNRIRIMFAGAAIVLLACDRPGISFVDPEVTAEGAAGLTVQVVLEDSALAEALGWQGGVPGAMVLLHRMGDPFQPETLVTDAAGVARKPDFLSGYFRVGAYRQTQDAETAVTDGVVRAFGGGARMRLGSPAVVTVPLRADQRGSLVISELYPAAPFTADIAYDDAHYHEVYNNADTTVYLDGILWGAAYWTDREFTRAPCEVTAPLRSDSLGIWARYWHRFPGSGRDYPLAPGAAAVFALDAVDHSQIDPRFPDLSGADFELQGTADVDNPSVPNMPEVGLGTWPFGHGLRQFSATPFFLALPVATEHLIRARSSAGDEFARIPADRVLDVVIPWYDRPGWDVRFVPCPVSVHPRFDRLEGGFHDTGTDLTLSFHRRILPREGMAVLQDDNTSFFDLVVAPRSLGTIAN